MAFVLFIYIQKQSYEKYHHGSLIFMLLDGVVEQVWSLVMQQSCSVRYIFSFKGIGIVALRLGCESILIIYLE